MNKTDKYRSEGHFLLVVTHEKIIRYYLSDVKKQTAVTLLCQEIQNLIIQDSFNISKPMTHL
jgi:hypothetical protein